MSIKINTVSLRETQMNSTQLPSIQVEKVGESTRPKIKIVSKTDAETIPGPDKHTSNTLNNGLIDEFHFLKSIIIDNELY